MKNMQSVPPQDRPKLIAVAVALVVVLGFVARNIVGATTAAAPKPPQQIAMSAPAASPAPAPAASPAGWAPGPAAASDSAGQAGGSAEAGWERLADPFHPVAGATGAGSPASAAPAAPRATPAPRPAARVAIAPRLAPVRPAPPVRMAARNIPAPRLAPGAAPSAAAARPGPAAKRPEAPSPAAPVAPSVPVALTGTVGIGAAAVATFRVGEATLFAQPEQIIAGWRVERIELGQVWLSHQHTLQVVYVGSCLASGPPPPGRSPAPAAAVRSISPPLILQLPSAGRSAAPPAG